MGQKANPIGNRLGIIRGWDSNWYADKDYGLKVVEDEKIATTSVHVVQKQQPMIHAIAISQFSTVFPVL